MQVNPRNSYRPFSSERRVIDRLICERLSPSDFDDHVASVLRSPMLMRKGSADRCWSVHLEDSRILQKGRILPVIRRISQARLTHIVKYRASTTIPLD